LTKGLTIHGRHLRAGASGACRPSAATARRRFRRELRGEIDHPPWRLSTAEAALARNGMGRQIGLELDGDPVLHYAAPQDVVWLNEPV
jgi:hypothetical protein